MKRKLQALICLLLTSVMSFSQNIIATSKISEVDVFRSMARETRTSTVNVPDGNFDVVLSGVTTQMIDPSLQVSVKGEATLLSATVRINYFIEEKAPDKDPKINRLQDSIQVLNIDLRWIGEERIIHEGELNLVNELLKPMQSKEGYKVQDMEAIADLYRRRITDLKKKLFDLGLKEENIIERISRFNGQLSELGSKQVNPVKEIVLSFASERPETIQLRCGYLVNSAGWNPMYDINVESTSKPVDLTYKAKIFQYTGMDWKDVELTVSTANPRLDNNRPVMSPKYIDYAVYRAVQNDNNMLYNNSATNMMQMERMNNEFIPLAIPVLQPVEIDPAEADMQVEFELARKQTIPSDGKEHIIKLKSYEVPATYKYHVVPKLDPSAFLLARITDYGQYNLLKGNANVFFGDNYVGEVLINPHIVSDTLLISLGRDERIVTKRIKVEEKSSKKLLSGVEKETFTWQITVRNNKSVPIEIEILDQIPLSRRKEIEVKLNDKGGADYHEVFGKLLWNYKIKANDAKKIEFGYTIEYPEGKEVAEQ